MIRRVEFTGSGDIVLSGELGTDVVKSGVVMLTQQQADEAVRHGWSIIGEGDPATQPPLIRVKR